MQGQSEVDSEQGLVLEPEQLRFILRLLCLPKSKRGRNGYDGISTNVIRWMIAYMIDFQLGIVPAPAAGEVGRGERRRGRDAENSFRQLSLYLGFAPSFYEHVKRSLLRFEDEILATKEVKTRETE